MFLKCSWVFFSSFIKNSAHLFHGSSFWNLCLYIGSSCYFMMLRLSQFCSCWYLYLSLVIMRLSFFKKTFKSIVIIFSTSLVFLKNIDMFLKCSWIILEFSFQKSLTKLVLTWSFILARNKLSYWFTLFLT